MITFFAGLSHEKNLHKMRVLTFMSLGETKSEVKFDDLCKELNFGLDEVEAFVIEGTKTCTVIFVGVQKRNITYCYELPV